MIGIEAILDPPAQCRNARILRSAGAALAQDSAAKWTQLQEAVRLAEICRGVTHDRETWRTLGAKIDAAVGHEIGGGERLTLIETAKTDARVPVKSVKTQKPKSPPVKTDAPPAKPDAGAKTGRVH